MAAKVFISYAPTDENYRNELVKHLKLLQANQLISVWHDRQILPGTNRDVEASRQLDDADIILLLVSADFIASDFCWDKEVKRAVERHTAGSAIVVPVILRTVAWETAPFGQLASLPSDGRPVRQWASIDAAMDNVVRGLQQLIEHKQQEQAKQAEKQRRQAAEQRFFEQLNLFLSDGQLSKEEREILMGQAQEFGLTAQQAKTLINTEYSKHKTYASKLREYAQTHAKFTAQQKSAPLSEKQTAILSDMQQRWGLSNDDVSAAIQQLQQPGESDAPPPAPPFPKKLIASAVLAVTAAVSVVTALVWPNAPSKAEVCPAELGDGISSGEETIFNRQAAASLTDLFERFQNCEDYAAIISQLNGLIAPGGEYKSDPELTIYRNNAEARQAAQSGPEAYVLAVAVPAGNSDSADAAKEILRGVADAQESFNLKQSSTGDSLLEIVIADDEDSVEVGASIAANLVADGRILGVLGHRSSEVTQAVMEIYSKAQIPVISSTSTSTGLRTYENFFRTVPADEDMAMKLAACLEEADIDKFVLYYDSNDPYSNAWRESLDLEFAEDAMQAVDFHRDNLEMSIANHSRSSGFDATIIAPSRDSYQRAVYVVSQNLEREPEEALQIFGTDILYEKQFLDEAGQAALDMVLAVPWFLDELSSYGLSASEKWSGRGSTISWRHATSYEAAVAFSTALTGSEDVVLNNARKARRVLLENLRSVNLGPDDVAGVPLQFDEWGERVGYRGNPPEAEDLEAYKAEIMTTFVQIAASNREDTSQLGFVELDSCAALSY